MSDEIYKTGEVDRGTRCLMYEKCNTEFGPGDQVLDIQRGYLCSQKCMGAYVTKTGRSVMVNRFAITRIREISA